MLSISLGLNGGLVRRFTGV